MTQVELRLIPAPGQKPEFLATLDLVNKSSPPPFWGSLQPPVIVLEGYTRDAWSLDTACKWNGFQVQSVDGRNKLPGFVKYLRERQKTAYGRFGDNLLVVPHKQVSSSTLNCRVAPLSSIPNCPLQPMQQPQPAAVPQPKVAPSASSSKPPATKKKGGFGLLGNLVGAQKRTNQQVETAATAVVPKSKAPDSTNDGPAAPGAAAPPMESKTAGQILAEFRSEMEQEMLDFDISSEPVLKVKIDLPGKLRLLSEEEKQSGRVTMEVLKYIVYEQAEEVNEEWIAHKEPSEFMDEAVIAIYKEGEAPPDVLEDMNKGELPDEIRGQQRAMQEQRQKAEQMKAQRVEAEQHKAALKSRGGGETNGEEEEDFAALNTQKRDRRTIEDFEREAKRRRGDE